MPSPDAYAALRNPVVRRFAGGRFGAVLGYQMVSVAVGWYLYERTGSALALGLVGAAEVAPVFLLLACSRWKAPARSTTWVRTCVPASPTRPSR